MRKLRFVRRFARHRSSFFSCILEGEGAGPTSTIPVRVVRGSEPWGRVRQRARNHGINKNCRIVIDGRRRSKMAGTLPDSFLEIVPSERSVLRFEDRRREGFITLYARKADDTILIEGGKGSIPRTFVISPTRPVQCLDGGPLPSGAYLFFKGLADQGPASIERSFMDVIDGLFSDS